MLFVKLVILFTFVMFVWSTYVTGKMKHDVIFNQKVNIEKDYPKWYLGFCVLVTINVLLVFIALVYFLFVIWG